MSICLLSCVFCYKNKAVKLNRYKFCTILFHLFFLIFLLSGLCPACDCPPLSCLTFCSSLVLHVMYLLILCKLLWQQLRQINHGKHLYLQLLVAAFPYRFAFYAIRLFACVFVSQHSLQQR